MRRLVHLGDQGCIPEEGQLEQMKGADVVMAPAGGFYTAEPEVIREIISRISPRVTILMHYHTEKSGYPQLAGCEKYLSLCSDGIRYETDTLELDGKTEKQTAVLQQAYFSNP